MEQQYEKSCYTFYQAQKIDIQRMNQTLDQIEKHLSAEYHKELIVFRHQFETQNKFAQQKISEVYNRVSLLLNQITPDDFLMRLDHQLQHVSHLSPRIIIDEYQGRHTFIICDENRLRELFIMLLQRFSYSRDQIISCQLYDTQIYYPKKNQTVSALGFRICQDATSPSIPVEPVYTYQPFSTEALKSNMLRLAHMCYGVIAHNKSHPSFFLVVPVSLRDVRPKILEKAVEHVCLPKGYTHALRAEASFWDAVQEKFFFRI